MFLSYVCFLTILIAYYIASFLYLRCVVLQLIDRAEEKQKPNLNNEDLPAKNFVAKHERLCESGYMYDVYEIQKLILFFDVTNHHFLYQC